MINQLGKALSILVKAEVIETLLHEDVAAWHAPSECHSLVSKGEVKRQRAARRHAEAVARAPLRIILKQAHERGKWQRSKNAAFMRLHARLSPF